MAEYIERAAANEAMRECVRAYPSSFYNGIEAARSVIIKLPAADVRPVVRANWKPGDIRNVSAVCSNCGHLRLGNGAEWATKLAYFCEKCGADMRPEPPKEGET